MKDMIISVTEAARNFSDFVNRVHYQNQTYVLLKNGVPFARLVPETTKRCTGRDLANALARTRLSTEEARGWHRDLKAARAILQAPTSKWQ
jgi:antitoxin (DNA-binding transcriptional repressor) of toxin-antitoxin stability system